MAIEKRYRARERGGGNAGHGTTHATSPQDGKQGSQPLVRTAVAHVCGDI